jgi:ribose 5-phosphate isomerase B
MTNSNQVTRIVIGADHAAFELKAVVYSYLKSAGYAANDIGTFSEFSVDYPDFAAAVAEQVADGHADLGILICGTGIGMAIAANKIAGIRAAVVHDVATARLSREHNNANIIAFGARILTQDQAIEIVTEFLAASFAGGRHERRIKKIAELDQAREHKL